MTLTKATDLTLRQPRITYEKFRQILIDRGSPARNEAFAIWSLLTQGGVDPSFALGQFHVESLMGRSGYAVTTKSWGNMLWDGAWTPTRAKYHPAGSDYTYASYPSWTEGVKDYVEYVQRYAVTLDYATNRVSDTIDTETSRWAGHPAGSPNHVTYVQIILHEINDIYEFVPGLYIETGDKMIESQGAGITSKKRYPVVNGTPLYRGTNGDVLKLAAFATSPGLCRFLGPVNQKWTDASWAWGAVIVNVKDLGEVVVYIKNPKPASVVTVA